MTPQRGTMRTKGLAEVLRETGRRFQDGKPIDIAMLRQSIEARRGRRPAMCSTLTELIQAAQDDTERGNRDSALKHFRAAIELAEGGSHMKLHSLSPEVKCPVCGGVLVYIRVRKFGDLYRCARGVKDCSGAVLHYQKSSTSKCGWAHILETGHTDRWIECADQPAAKGE